MANTSAVYARIDAQLKENAEAILAQLGITPVSYTHLDVYKRQQRGQTMCFPACCRAFKSSSLRSIRSVKGFSSFQIHHRARVRAVGHTQRSAAVPRDVNRADVIHSNHGAKRARFQIGPVGVVHAK